MSHIVTITTEIRDPAAIAAACRRLNLRPPVESTVRLYSSTASGWAVQLPGWRYPIVADLKTGALRYDNFGGLWGEQRPDV